MAAFENPMQARENEQRREGPFDICCCWDRTTPHCVVNVLKCLFRLAALGEGGKWRNMRTGTPLQPDKCFIYTHTNTHTHALDTIRLFLDPEKPPLIKILICRTIKSQWIDTWCIASACIFSYKNCQWQNYRCHFPYNELWRVSHHARSCALYEITLSPFTADILCIQRDSFLTIASLCPNMCSVAQLTSSDLGVPHRHVPPRFDSACLCSFQCVHHLLLSVLSVPTCCPTNDRLIQIWEHFFVYIKDF